VDRGGWYCFLVVDDGRYGVIIQKRGMKEAMSVRVDEQGRLAREDSDS
jgi:hypothetical protein